MRSKLAIVLFILTLSSGCVKVDDIRVGKVTLEDVKMRGLKNITATPTIEITNSSRRNIELKELTVTCGSKEDNFATITLQEGVKLPKKSEKVEIAVPIYAKFASLSKMVAIGSNISTLEMDITIKFRSGLFVKKYEFKSLTIEQIGRMVGVDINQLLK